MSIADLEMITPELSRRWDLEAGLATLRKEAAKVGVLIETKAKFDTGISGIFRCTSEIRIIDPKSSRIASVFGSMALKSSAVAGAIEAEFARKWSKELWELRESLVKVTRDMVNEPEWSVLNLEDRPLKITLWKDGNVSGRDLYKHSDVAYGGWLSDDDILSPYRVVHYPTDFKKEFDFYTVEF
jgi:hypothetical protein